MRKIIFVIMVLGITILNFTKSHDNGPTYIIKSILK